jgi:polysaccharide export outer membrane protein
VLALAIAGEPDLPERYTVRPDGTIRIPFVGSVRVQGMTADQIREAVARQLSERNLKANPSVTVTIRRPVR